MNPRIRNVTAFLCAWLVVLMTTQSLKAQDNEIKPEYQTTSTVYGGTSTGLFNSLGTRTLKRGEFTFGAFWNNFDRVPGDLDINQVPINFTVGITNRWEVFGNVDVYQQVTTRLPFSMSGTQMNGLRSTTGGDPFLVFGPPVGGRDGGAGYFPGTQALGGGILPTLGSMFGPRYLTNRPSFYNDLPFFGPASFNPATGNYDVRTAGDGVGNVTLGTKVALINPDRRFTVALAGLFRIPTKTGYDALADGRSAGAFDFGPMLVLGQSMGGHRVRVTENFGYMKSGDPGKNGVTIIDRRDQFLANLGLEVAAHQNVVVVGEWNNTIYVGSGTPNLDPKNPMDLVAGVRIFGWDGKFMLGGGFRRLLNPDSNRNIPAVLGNGNIINVPIGGGDVNGFVLNLGFGRRIKPIPPPPPNRPPSCVLDASPGTVLDGQGVAISSRVSDPDNDVVTFSWTSSAGQIQGSGSSVNLDTTGVNSTPGAPPTRVTVQLMVDDGRGETSSCDVAVTVNAPELPRVNRPPSIQGVSCNQVVGTPLVPGQVTDGETVRVRATATDPDGDPLSYRWTSSTGQLRGSGSDVTLATAGVTAGPGAPAVTITINLTVDDGQGGTDSASCTLTVSSVEKPKAERLSDLEFPRRGARVDNVHKAILDDVALRLQQEPTTQLVVDGHADRGEPISLAQRRADNVKAYLVKEKGIDPDRIIVRSFGTDRPHASGDRPKNRRVELWIVPSGADFPE